MGHLAREKQMVTYPLAATGDDIIVTTTPQLEGFQVERYIGVVCGDAMLEACTRNLEKALARERAVATHNMVRKARAIGANAVLGLRFRCGAVPRMGVKYEACAISAYGTAAKVRATETARHSTRR